MGAHKKAGNIIGWDQPRRVDITARGNGNKHHEAIKTSLGDVLLGALTETTGTDTQ
jgi:hypothetical protein